MHNFAKKTRGASLKRRSKIFTHSDVTLNVIFELLFFCSQGRRLYILKVFIEYPLNIGSGCISMFSVNLTLDKTLTIQFCYYFLQKSPLFGL